KIRWRPSPTLPQKFCVHAMHTIRKSILRRAYHVYKTHEGLQDQLHTRSLNGKRSRRKNLLSLAFEPYTSAKILRKRHAYNSKEQIGRAPRREKNSLTAPGSSLYSIAQWKKK